MTAFDQIVRCVRHQQECSIPPVVPRVAALRPNLLLRSVAPTPQAPIAGLAHVLLIKWDEEA